MKMDTPKLDGLLEEFAKHMRGAKNKCVLVGSVPLAILGLRDVNDLDVIVSGEWFAKLKPVAMDVHEERLAIQTPHGVIQVSTKFYNFAADCGVSVAELRRDATEWVAPSGHWRVISMGHFRKFKESMGRQKDLEDLRLLDTNGKSSTE